MASNTTRHDATMTRHVHTRVWHYGTLYNEIGGTRAAAGSADASVPLYASKRREGCHASALVAPDTCKRCATCPVVVDICQRKRTMWTSVSSPPAASHSPSCEKPRERAGYLNSENTWAFVHSFAFQSAIVLSAAAVATSLVSNNVPSSRIPLQAKYSSRMSKTFRHFGPRRMVRRIMV